MSTTLIRGDRRHDAWRDDAACRGCPTAWWFDGDAFSITVAVAICRRCQVRDDCLEDALTSESSYDRDGIRGGYTARERDRLQTSARRVRSA